MITVSAEMLDLCSAVFVSIFLMPGGYLFAHYLLNILED
jgi:hypothetical protein